MWPASPILFNGVDSLFRMTLVTGTSSFDPGYVHLDEFVMNSSHIRTFADGNLTVTLNGAGATADGGVVDFMELEYTIGDCNGNNVPDECDITLGTSDDCNANLLPDECELLTSYTPVNVKNIQW